MNQERDTTNTQNRKDASEQVAEAQQKAADKARQAGEEARAKASEMAGQAQSKASDLTAQAKAKASDVANQVKGEAKTTFDEQKSRAADQVDTIASALRQSSEDLRTNDQAAFARYTDLAADQVENLSGYVRSKGFDDVLHDIRELAHRQPEIFVAGTLAAGFFLGRFLKSSQRRQGGSRSRNYADANRAYVGYYEDRERSYPYGEYQPVSSAPSYGARYGASGARVPETHEFRGGATAYNGERTTPAQYGTGTGTEPAVTGADWGAQYDANEYGQTEPEADEAVKSSQDKEKSNYDSGKS